MDDFGHEHDIRDFAQDIVQLSRQPMIKEGTLILSRNELKYLFAEACGGDVSPATHGEPMAQGRVMGHGGTAQMARSSLQNVAASTQSLHDRLADEDELPEWVQAKIASVLDDVHEIEDHLGYKMRRHDELG